MSIIKKKKIPIILVLKDNLEFTDINLYFVSFSNRTLLCDSFK